MQPGRDQRFVIDRAAYARAGYPATAHGADRRAGHRARPAGRADRLSSRCATTRRAADARGRRAASRCGSPSPDVDLRNAARRAHASDLRRPSTALYRDLVVNYERPARRSGASRWATYVIICPNNAAVITALAAADRVAHAQGLPTSIWPRPPRPAPRSTQIKTWLQNAYNTWENPPEYVAPGRATPTAPIAIPCLDLRRRRDRPSLHRSSTATTSWPTSHVGRISVDTRRPAAALRRQDRRLREHALHDRHELVHARLPGRATRRTPGSPASRSCSGSRSACASCGYAEVDTIFAAPFVTQMTTALNRGDTIFSYRGYYGMSGCNTGHIGA